LFLNQRGYSFWVILLEPEQKFQSVFHSTTLAPFTKRGGDEFNVEIDTSVIQNALMNLTEVFIRELN